MRIRPIPTVLALLLLAAPSAAVVPGEVEFQGLLLDAGGQPVDGAVDLDFALFDVDAGGTPLWSESHADVQVVNGVYDVTLGSITPITPAIVSGGSLYLEITADGETLAPRERLAAVPYAVRAQTAESAETVGGVSNVFVSQIFQHVDFDGAAPPNDDPREGVEDTDGDGLANFIDPDNDDDGISDGTELAEGSDINLVTPIITGFAPPSADGFEVTTVQVQGQNFEPGLSLVFGTQSPVPSNVTPTSFDVDVGPQPEGDAAVQVTNSNGELASASFPFFLLTPTIASLTPPFAPAADTTMVTVQGTNFVPGITVSFGTESPTPSNVTPTSFDVVVGPQAVSNATVVVTHPNGKSSAPAGFAFLAPRLVFATSDSFAGNLGGIAGADAKCAQAASDAGLAGTFLAWISDSTQSPSTRFAQAGGGWGLVTGTIVASDYADLTDGALTSPIDRDELGNPLPDPSYAWTGTDVDGTHIGPTVDCDAWTLTSGNGRRGLVGSTTSWTHHSTAICTIPAHLYCFEQ